MRWRTAIHLLCFAAALGCGAHDALAQETDQETADGRADEEIPVVPKKPSGWSILLDPLNLKLPAFDLTGGMPDRMIYFGGFDLWRYGIGTYSGAQWSPGGVNKDGFILRFFGSQNIERYSNGTNSFRSEIIRAAIMPGYKFTRGHADIQVLGRFDVEGDYLSLNDRYSASRGRIGAGFTVDTWWEPTRSLLVQYSLSGTMIDNAINTRIATGWRLFNRFWVGPEASMSSDYFSRQYRVGAHLTGLRTGPVEWSIAAGHIQDSFHRDGVYGRINLMVRPPRQPFFEN